MIEIKKKPVVVCLPIVSLSGRTKHPCEWAHGELTIKLWKDQVEASYADTRNNPQFLVGCF